MTLSFFKPIPGLHPTIYRLLWLVYDNHITISQTWLSGMETTTLHCQPEGCIPSISFRFKPNNSLFLKFHAVFLSCFKQPLDNNKLAVPIQTQYLPHGQLPRSLTSYIYNCTIKIKNS